MKSTDRGRFIARPWKGSKRRSRTIFQSAGNATSETPEEVTAEYEEHNAKVMAEFEEKNEEDVAVRNLWNFDLKEEQK